MAVDRKELRERKRFFQQADDDWFGEWAAIVGAARHKTTGQFINGIPPIVFGLAQCDLQTSAWGKGHGKGGAIADSQIPIGWRFALLDRSRCLGTWEVSVAKRIGRAKRELFATFLPRVALKPEFSIDHIVFENLHTDNPTWVSYRTYETWDARSSDWTKAVDGYASKGISYEMYVPKLGKWWLGCRQTWTVTLSCFNAPSFRLVTDAVGVLAIFADREAPRHESGKRKALAHWVSAHTRRQRKDPDAEIQVQRAMRGVNDFEWLGFTCHIDGPQPG